MVRSLVVGAGSFPSRIVTEEEHRDAIAPFAPLPQVANAVEQVARALTRAGVVSGVPTLDPDRDGFRDVWARTLDEAAGEPLVVHFSGHGEVARDGTSLCLAVGGSERGDRLWATTIEAGDLLRDVENRSSGPVLFLLDVCGGGQALATQLAQRLSGNHRKAWVIAACAADETTHGARFSNATATVLRNLADGRLDLSPALEHVPVSTLAREIDRDLARTAHTSNATPQTVVRTPRTEAYVDPPPFFRNPAHATDPAGRYLARLDASLRQFALESDPGLDPAHFVTRASGAPHGTCLFSGRDGELRRIQGWLENPDTDNDRLLVVTGGPGSGKSALLGVTVCVAHPALEPIRGPVLGRVQDRFMPDSHGHVLAVHARERTLAQVVDSLTRQLPDTPRAIPTVPSHSPVGDHNRLFTRLRDVGPVTIVLDALDESPEPTHILGELLLPLATAEDIPCRIMIGTRPWWDALPSLHRAIRDRPDRVLDLDTRTPDELTRELTGYLAALLYGRFPAATARAIAHRLAHATEHGAFLIASLYADHLLHQDATADHDVARITAELPCNITAMFDLHVARLAHANPWIRPVLAALGQARGRGIPLELLHAVAVGHHGPHADDVLPADITATREALAQAWFYLRTDADTDGRLLYRYYHQALAEHTAHVADPTTTHQALLDTIPRSNGHHRDWALAHPYLHRHAPTHAVTAGYGAFDELLTDPAFVLHVDPDHLAPHLHHATIPAAVDNAYVYRTTTTHHPRRHDIEARRSLLAIDAAAWRKPALAHALATTALDHKTAGVIPLWATSLVHPARRHTLTGHTNAVYTVVTLIVDGRPHAVTTSCDKTAIVWDLTTGTRRHTLTGHTHPVNSVATATVDGRPHAVTTSCDETAIVWDLTTGTPRHTLTGHTDEVCAVATVTIDGRPHAVTTSCDETAIVWDLSTGTRRHTLNGHASAVATVTVDGRPLAITSYDKTAVVWDLTTGTRRHTLTGHTHPVNSVATATVDGRPHAVTTSNDETAIVWDLTTGTPRHTLTGHTHPVNSVATATVDGRPHAVTTSNDKTAIVWDLTTGTPRHTLTGHTHPVLSVATVTINGHPHAVTSGYGKIAVVWDLTAGTRRHTLTGHTDVVLSLATATVDGRPHAVSAGHDETAMVWDLTTEPRSRAARTGHTSSVNAVATVTVNNRLHAVTTSHDKTAIVWDLTTGTPRHTLTGHTHPVNAVATATVDGRPHAVTTSNDKTAIVWDLTTGTPRHTLTGHTHPVNAVATATVDGRPHAVTSNDKTAIVWDLTTGTRRHTLTGHTGVVYTVATATIDGRPHAITTSDDTAMVWDLTTGTRRHTLTGHSHMWHAVATITVKGRPHAVTTGHDKTALVWDLTTGTRRHTLTGHTDMVTSVATVTVDGRPHAITTGHDETAMVWDLINGIRRHTLTGHTNAVISVSAVIIDGRPHAVTTGHDGTAMVWDLITGLEVCRIHSARAPRVAGVVAATSTGLVATFDLDVACFVWNLTPHAC
ncbi:caspase family protein (plasmid) [Embleya sp. NBC_00888]|uniref:hypothetical protein n=1 Tax=Embleya sp. NBC_00888 TaxID=2975960 RepID=UPI002F90BA7A|nr:caspase family protein [Embleya sp. NBC_00888]